MRIYDDVWKKNLSKRAIFLFNLDYGGKVFHRVRDNSHLSTTITTTTTQQQQLVSLYVHRSIYRSIVFSEILQIFRKPSSSLPISCEYTPVNRSSALLIHNFRAWIYHPPADRWVASIPQILRKTCPHFVGYSTRNSRMGPDAHEKGNGSGQGSRRRGSSSQFLALPSNMYRIQSDHGGQCFA